jgi:hypothetical protein
MGTWIAHLRIAEKILGALPQLNETMFTFGSLAPDSGMPNADWSKFEPPKAVSHFQNTGEGEDKIRDMEFYRGYMQGVAADDARYSYLLGYYVHLLCDKLFVRWINPTYYVVYAKELAEQGVDYFWTLKKDWYDLDHRYVRDHPESLFWRVYLKEPLPPLVLPFINEAALQHQTNHIRTFYSDGKERDLDRAYPYMNEATMARYVDDCARVALKLIPQLEDVPAGEHSSLCLLDESEFTRYAPPLGDG